MAKELKKRSEVEEKFTWNLADIYKSENDWEKDLLAVGQLGDDLSSFEGKIGNDADTLFEVLETLSKGELLIRRTFEYAERLYDQDQTNAHNQSMEQRVFSVACDFEVKTSFIAPEIQTIPEDKLESFYSEKKELELYRKFIAEINRTKEHTLSAELEKFISMTSEMARTPENIYGVIHNADFVFPEITDENGEKVRLSNGNFVPFEESSDRRVRKEAFEKYYSVYKQFSHTLASIYDGQVKQLSFNAKARKYPSTLEAAVDANNVPSSVYFNLIEAVHKNMDKMHRYVKLRKKLLGVDELHMYDVYTPMIDGVAKKISFEEAKEITLKALAPLGEDYVSKVREGYENRWIDVYENEGKRSGAYSAGCYGVHPYVLLNHNDTLDNMFTLIHEMGHSIHTYYSCQNQPFIYSEYKIFVAEVASTCNEVLLMEYLLKNCKDKNERIYLLNHYLDSFKGTVYRQCMFAEFEMLTNKMVEDGESLNAENLSNLYMKLNKQYFGDDMISDPEIAYEWARIPHFYYNFYVYQYSTSYCAAVTIAHNILEEGAPAVERYKKFLSGGCSESPVDLLKIAGVDMTKPESIQKSLDVFGKVLDEIEALI